MAGGALIDAWRADSARRRRETSVALDPAEHARAAHYDGAERDDTPDLVRADAASVGPGYVLSGTGLQELPRPARLAKCPLKEVTTT